MGIFLFNLFIDKIDSLDKKLYGNRRMLSRYVEWCRKENPELWDMAVGRTDKAVVEKGNKVYISRILSKTDNEETVQTKMYRLEETKTFVITKAEIEEEVKRIKSSDPYHNLQDYMKYIYWHDVLDIWIQNRETS